MSLLRVACIQVCPGNDMAANLAAAREAALEATAQRADLIAFPEFVSFLDRSGRAMAGSAAAEDQHPALAAFRALAIECRTWLSVGSLVVRDLDADRLSNRGYVIGPDGEIHARYDKLHMFDAVLADGTTISESRAYRPGSEAVVVDTPWCRLGVSICYDLRFPMLFRVLAQCGASILLVPSAFTAQTGELHWKPLLQARAIENGCFVVAAATCGEHPGPWRTYGRSMVIDPQGRVLAQAGESPTVLLADLDMDDVVRARQAIPSLTADRPFSKPHMVGKGHEPSLLKLENP